MPAHAVRFLLILGLGLSVQPTPAEEGAKGGASFRPRGQVPLRLP